MSDPQRTTYEADPIPRRWRLRICPCGVADLGDSECAGFPGVWDEDRGDFDRGSCLAEWVSVVEEGAA